MYFCSRQNVREHRKTSQSQCLQCWPRCSQQARAQTRNWRRETEQRALCWSVMLSLEVRRCPHGAWLLAVVAFASASCLYYQPRIGKRSKPSLHPTNSTDNKKNAFQVRTNTSRGNKGGKQHTDSRKKSATLASQSKILQKLSRKSVRLLQCSVWNLDRSSSIFACCCWWNTTRTN